MVEKKVFFASTNICQAKSAVISNSLYQWKGGGGGGVGGGGPCVRRRQPYIHTHRHYSNEISRSLRDTERLKIDAEFTNQQENKLLLEKHETQDTYRLCPL